LSVRDDHHRVLDHARSGGRVDARVDSADLLAVTVHDGHPAGALVEQHDAVPLGGTAPEVSLFAPEPISWPITTEAVASTATTPPTTMARLTR
jgi:hypothetical protein